ncbi:hypothetical protein B4100_1560 [Heyndrickxia coagulans]|nr:hypothetical protein B4100_1560 [Heyndrickxia coagulans]
MKKAVRDHYAWFLTAFLHPVFFHTKARNFFRVFYKKPLTEKCMNDMIHISAV